MNSKIVMCRGLMGSGKSTFAKKKVKEDGFCRLNRDDLRVSVFGPEYKFNKNKEKLIVLMQVESAKALIKEGQSVIIDDTNLSSKTWNLWENLSKELSVPLVCQDFTHVPIEECIRRDAQREKTVGRPVIEYTALNSGLFKTDKQISIFDLDGTLYNADHRMHFIEGEGKKDWRAFHSSCKDDTIRADVYGLLLIEISLGREIILLTGRNSYFWPETNKRLEEDSIPYSHIFMKSDGDFRQDWEWKEEVINKLPKDQIAFAIDDRDKTCEMYARNGINVINCGG